MQSSRDNHPPTGYCPGRGDWVIVDDRTTLWRLARGWEHKADEIFDLLLMYANLMRGAICKKIENEEKFNYLIEWMNRTVFWSPNTPNYINIRIDKKGDIDLYYSDLSFYAMNLNYIYKSIPNFAAAKDSHITLNLSFGVGGGYSPIKFLNYYQDSGKSVIYKFDHLPGAKVKTLLEEIIVEIKKAIDQKGTYHEDEIEAMPLTEYAKECLRQAGIRTRADAMSLLIGLSSTKVGRGVMAELKACFKIRN